MQELLEEKTDTETGEIQLTEEEFALVEANKWFLTDAAYKAPEQRFSIDLLAMRSKHIDKMGDIIAKKLEQAKRYREQAERRAKPLEKSAEWLLLQLTPLVRELAEQKLKKDKNGKYASKTLNLPSCSFSFTKSGGPVIFNENLAIAWCREKEFNQFIEDKLKTKELMDFLKKSDALDEAPFIVNHKVDEFAKVKVKLD